MGFGFDKNIPLNVDNFMVHVRNFISKCCEVVRKIGGRRYVLKEKNNKHYKQTQTHGCPLACVITSN